MPSNNELSLPLITDENICLPLAINLVSKYWNVDLPMSEAIENSKKYQHLQRTVLIEGIELAERHGLGSLILNSTLEHLKKTIDLGIPPIVILPGLHNTIQHASVISGYDEIEKTIMHYIPTPDQIGIIPAKKFDMLWKEDNRLMLILAPTDIIYTIKSKNNFIEKSNRLCFISERSNIQNNSDAFTTLNKAIEINDQNPMALCMLGSLLNEKNSVDCLQYYEKCIDINNKYYLAYRGIANYYLKNKQYEKAESYYTSAITINPDRFGPIYKNRAITRLEQNKTQLAKQDLVIYIKQIPNAKDKSAILDLLKTL